MKRVNVAMSDDVHRRLKILTIMKGTSMSEYILNLIMENLEKDEKEAKNEKN